MPLSSQEVKNDIERIQVHDWVQVYIDLLFKGNMEFKVHIRKNTTVRLKAIAIFCPWADYLDAR